MNFVLIPLITEKSMQDANMGKFTFKAPRFVTKKDVKKSIESRFDVNVVKISTVNVKGRTMRIGERRTEVSKTPWKKAVVELKKGQKISSFELGEDK